MYCGKLDQLPTTIRRTQWSAITIPNTASLVANPETMYRPLLFGQCIVTHWLVTMRLMMGNHTSRHTKCRPGVTTVQPSPYQQAILDWLRDDTGSAIIDAVAGAGKTSTLVMLANAMPRNANAVFLAFNKSIATELKARLPEHVRSATFHSLGGNVLKRYAESRLKRRINWSSWTDARKCERIFDATYIDDDAVTVRSSVIKLVSLFKAHAYMPDVSDRDATQLIIHFDISSESDKYSDDDIIRMARTVLAESNLDLATIDFDDMLYMPVIFNLSLDKYQYVMVDESQDTNPVQRDILRRLMGRGSRLIAVGDPFQAIYGFRGASSDAMESIKRDFECKTLPLSITYRCPASVVREAQTFVSHIMARDNAPDGQVSTLDTFKIADFRSTDLLVCRNTAPLVQLAYRMIAARLPARIMGRDIGRGLTSLIRKLAGRRGTLDTLPTKIEEYCDREMAKAFAKRQEARAQSVDDKCASILALIDSLTSEDEARGIDGLCRVIDDMFSDTRNGCTTLATVHKAKGLEAPRVFIIDPQLMPSRYAKQAWQQEQERNLQYVAITRALETLHYVESRAILS